MAYASVASVKDKDGLLPIHLAANGRYSEEVIVSPFPEADDDSFPYFSAAELEVELMYLVSANKNKYILSTKNQSGSLLLHSIISRGYSLELIRVVILSCKNALIEANSKGLMPLHNALCSKSDDEIVHFLLEENLQAAVISTKSGDLPIHLAIENKFDAGIVSHLIELYPECLVKKGMKGLVHLNLAIDLNYSYDVVLAIFESYPALKEGAKSIAFQKEVGKYKRLPLHNGLMLRQLVFWI